MLADGGYFNAEQPGNGLMRQPEILILKQYIDLFVTIWRAAEYNLVHRTVPLSAPKMAFSSIISLSIIIKYFLNGIFHIGVTHHHSVMGKVVSLFENRPKYL